MEQLLPMDILTTNVTSPWWPPKETIQAVFSHVLYARQWLSYPGKFVKCNHNRIYIGFISLETIKICIPDYYDEFKSHANYENQVELVFHFTNPRARFCVFQPWMVDPEVSKISRYSANPLFRISASEVLYACICYDKTPYDYGQLLDMAFGLSCVFDFSRKWKVCSAGVRAIADLLAQEYTIPGIDPEKTMPCAFVNASTYTTFGGI